MTSPLPAPLPPLTLILGGARSGKSRLAEGLFEGIRGAKTYIATADIRDEEMAERVALHQERRGPEWVTLHAPLDLGAALRTADEAQRPVLLDCLTLWLTNVMLADKDVAAETLALSASLETLSVPVVMVSNEVGLGIVPSTPLGRRFRDAQGVLNQSLARVATDVVFVVAGLPLTLKSSSTV